MFPSSSPPKNTIIQCLRWYFVVYLCAFIFIKDIYLFSRRVEMRPKCSIPQQVQGVLHSSPLKASAADASFAPHVIQTLIFFGQIWLSVPGRRAGHYGNKIENRHLFLLLCQYVQHHEEGNLVWMWIAIFCMVTPRGVVHSAPSASEKKGWKRFCAAINGINRPGRGGR